MNVTCPECTTTYRVDPAKIPSDGILAQCSRCPGTFRVILNGAGPESEAGLPASAGSQDATSVEGVREHVVSAMPDHAPEAALSSDIGESAEAAGSVMGGADGADLREGQSYAEGGTGASADGLDGPDYPGASDVAFHTEAEPEDLPYLEPPVAPSTGRPHGSTFGLSEPEGQAEGSVDSEGPPSDEPVQEEQEDGTPAPVAPGETPLPPAPFGARSDPHRRAVRLARALVSDIVVYHPERRTRSLRQGTLRQEFREEIRKSWEEYANQVGSDFARQTTYFRDALNEILAEGATVF